MIKILHTADWHLDAPLSAHTEEAAEFLRRELRKVPQRIAALCRQEGCDLMLIAGDLFDGKCGGDTVRAVRETLASVEVPVFISPGNHDFCGADSPYLTQDWPDNVHIFKAPQLESVSLPALDCRLYGAGYSSMDCPGLLKRFRAEGPERWHIGLLHADAGSSASPYCPITRYQIQESGLHYLALGHIHKKGSLPAGETVCAWPGCPMGHGFDELGPKGVLIATLDETVSLEQIPLDTPRFYDEEVDVSDDAAAAVTAALPAVQTQDFYRITLTGYSGSTDTDTLRAKFPHIPNLILRDSTVPATDLWQNIDDDTLEGLLLSSLKESADSPSEVLSARAVLAARICRKILDGQEVKLP